MFTLFTKKGRTQALLAASQIAIQMQQEGYDRKTLFELVDRLEHVLFPGDFEQ
jgi:hypothetical protein